MSTRFFHDGDLAVGQTVLLNTTASHHLLRVMRASVGASVVLFNGQGGEYAGTLVVAERGKAQVQLETYSADDRELPLRIHLGYGLAKAGKMDLVLQKATELGVDAITPLLTERCEVRLSAERVVKRMQHWRGVLLSACEQCGRNRVPTLYEPRLLADWLIGFDKQHDVTSKVVLVPGAEQLLGNINVGAGERIGVLIGPEGGLGSGEIALAEQHGCKAMSLGARTLRTETAAIAALAFLSIVSLQNSGR